MSREIRSSGFALLAVLWITAVLSVLAMSYATSARVDVEGIRNMHRRQILDNDLLSALVLGEHEYKKFVANMALWNKKDEIESRTGKALNLWHPRFEPFNATIRGQTVFIRMTDLSGKIALSAANSALMNKILEACGIDEPGRDEIRDVWLDWEDGDDLHRLNGAETDYYQNTVGGYMAKNAKMENPEELLLLKGVTPKIYYGSEKHPGLIYFFSARGSSTVMDVNSAHPRAFAMVKDLSDQDIERIVNLRMEKPIQNLDDLNEIIPAQTMSEFKKYFGFPPSVGIQLQASIHENSTFDQGMVKLLTK
ncbi:MAG: hypothetical protein EOM12_04960 [Verrucomicrobiae bacterium]|nr:hypothetical protein [Verrucomicrobiae bacterium]